MMRQYHYAIEDALMTIQLKPDWSKVRTKITSDRKYPEE
jgi:hypothetical protein